jgi:hypothetical protein
MSAVPNPIPAHWLIPRDYTIAGCSRPTQDVLNAILRGDPDLVAKLLTIYGPDKGFTWRWEPYCNIQSKAQLAALKLVLDDPRFLFSAEFVCASMYFTPMGIRRLVALHPRAKRWFDDPESVAYEYKEEVMKTRPWNVGLNDRAAYGYKGSQGVKREWVRKQNQRLAFILYPALRFWAQRRLEEMYAPGGAMARAAVARLEAADATRSAQALEATAAGGQKLTA